MALSHSHSIVETLCPALFLCTCSFCERNDLQLGLWSVQLGTVHLMRPCSPVGGNVTWVPWPPVCVVYIELQAGWSLAHSWLRCFEGSWVGKC